jgi:hypothetical protein
MALDHVMTSMVGDVGDFGQKLDAMVDAGHLSASQRETLTTVIDAGSAAAHRGFKPQRALLEEMVVTMEGVIRNHYVTGPALRAMQALVPPRPRKSGRAR